MHGKTKSMILKRERTIAHEGIDGNKVNDMCCKIIDIGDTRQSNFKVGDRVKISMEAWLQCSDAGTRNPFEVPFPEDKVCGDIMMLVKE